MSASAIEILLVDDDEDALFLTKDLLAEIDSQGFNIRWCARYEDVSPELEKGKIDVCLVDHYLGAHTGLELIKELTDAGIKIPFILITGRGDREIDLAAMNAGAADYLTKDELTGDLLDRSIRYAIQRSRDEKDRLKLEAMLIQSQKMEAIGLLAAGVAHEINTPIQYIGSNLEYIKNKIPFMFNLLEELKNLHNDNTQEIPAAKIEKALSFKTNILTGLIDSEDGIRRITDITKSVQDFAHPFVSTEKSLCNLHEIINMTVKLAISQWRYVAKVKTDFSPAITAVPIIKGRFEQALVNLLVNAAHAIAERQKVNDEKGLITLKTTALNDHEIEIRVSDNGCGIPPEIINKIFDLFFTTKGIGQGTGQGLALVHSVFCHSHLGTVRVESQVNEGSTFVIVIPSK